MTQLNDNNLMQLKQQFATNPLFKRAENMAKGKSPQELKEIAENLCQQKGIDFNNAWETFQKQFHF